MEELDETCGLMIEDRPPISAVPRRASPTVPTGLRSPASQPNPSRPWARRWRRSAASLVWSDGWSATCPLRTRSGRIWSISAVSSAPPWMPVATSPSGRRPGGRPNRFHEALAQRSPRRRRRSSAAASTACVLPPCEDTIAIRAKPASATPSPSRMIVSVATRQPSESVPGKARCSSEAPTRSTGRKTASRSPGSRAMASSTMASAMIASVPSGRCSPCCSTAATGSTATARSRRPRRAASSALVSSSNRRASRFIPVSFRPRRLVEAPREW